jgi:hypothetical protein
MSQCSCGRGIERQRAIRGAGQSVAVCTYCMNEHYEQERERAFSGAGFEFRIPREVHTERMPCAWCGTQDDLVGVIDRGGRWWICRSCYIIETHERPWIPEEHAAEFAECLTTFRRAFGASPRPDASRHRSGRSDGAPAGSPFLVAPRQGHVPLLALYRATPSPTGMGSLEDDLDDAMSVPGYEVVCGADRDLGETPWAGVIDHSGAVRPRSSRDLVPEPLPDWWSPMADALEATAWAEASSVLAWLDPTDDLDSVPAPSQHELWSLRLVFARFTAAMLPSEQRKAALDAMCGLGYYGDTRPELVPDPADVASGSWTPPPAMPLTTDHRRRFPTWLGPGSLA